jgi:hypothetical protein
LAKRDNDYCNFVCRIIEEQMLGGSRNIPVPGKSSSVAFIIL